jgi:hypothetical protein
VRRMNLFRFERFRTWKNNFFIHFHTHLLMECLSCSWVCPQTLCAYSMVGFRALLVHRGN